LEYQLEEHYTNVTLCINVNKQKQLILLSVVLLNVVAPDQKRARFSNKNKSVGKVKRSSFSAKARWSYIGHFFTQTLAQRLFPERDIFPTLTFLNIQWPYSQHFIFFVSYDRAQKARVFVHSKPFQPSVTKHYSFIGTSTSYRENEVLYIHPQKSYSQHFIFFVSYEWAQKARVFVLFSQNVN
jgi:hypothetical protein